MCDRRSEMQTGKASSRMVGGSSPEARGQRDNGNACMPRKLATKQVGNSGCNARESSLGVDIRHPNTTLMGGAGRSGP
jgi:hypothetical protein